LGHWDVAVELIRPQSGIVTIDGTDSLMAMAAIKPKSASLHWEFMFTRAMHQTLAMVEQHNLSNYVAYKIDADRTRTTVLQTLTPINAANMREAHRLIETGTAKGKTFIKRF
jgi:NADPH:quinone reductase-like Zn-dependent oxidoreductase